MSLKPRPLGGDPGCRGPMAAHPGSTCPQRRTATSLRIHFQVRSVLFACAQMHERPRVQLGQVNRRDGRTIPRHYSATGTPTPLSSLAPALSPLKDYRFAYFASSRPPAPPSPSEVLQRRILGGAIVGRQQKAAVGVATLR